MSKSKVVLFGGATGDSGKYTITGDTYSLDLISNKWTKLEGKTVIYLRIKQYAHNNKACCEVFQKI